MELLKVETVQLKKSKDHALLLRVVLCSLPMGTLEDVNMKRFFAFVISFFAFALLSGTALGATKQAINIPRAVTVGATTLAPGNYDVEWSGDSSVVQVTFMKDKKLIVTSPQIAFDDYANEEIPPERVINIMVGDLQRIKIYPAKGFQVPQDIPAEVWQAYERLVALGFNKHLVKE